MNARGIRSKRGRPIDRGTLYKLLRAGARRCGPSGAHRCGARVQRGERLHAVAETAEAEAQWDNVADALREKNDRLGAMMDASREDVLADMDFPKERWAQRWRPQR